jgi:hypothetical protein
MYSTLPLATSPMNFNRLFRNAVPGISAVILGGVVILEGSIRIQLSLLCSNQLSLQFWLGWSSTVTTRCSKRCRKQIKLVPHCIFSFGWGYLVPTHCWPLCELLNSSRNLAAAKFQARISGCIAFWSATGDYLPYLIQASRRWKPFNTLCHGSHRLPVPTAAFLIFGTQSVSISIIAYSNVWFLF